VLRPSARVVTPIQQETAARPRRCARSSAVVIADASQRGLAWADVPGYVAAQCVGAIGGVWAAHAMFDERILMLATHVRHGFAQMLSEFVATFGVETLIDSEDWR